MATLAVAVVWAGACGDPGIYSRGPGPDGGGTHLEGTGGTIVPREDGGAGGNGTGGTLASDGGGAGGRGATASGGGFVAAGGGGSGGIAVGTAGAAGTGSGGGGRLGTGGAAPGSGGGGEPLGSGGAAGAPGTGAGAGGGRPGSGGSVATGGSVSTGGAIGSGGSVATGGTSALGGAGGSASDTANITFESSSEGWHTVAGTLANVGRSTTRHFAGAASLGGTLQFTGGSAGVTNTLAVSSLPTPAPGPGSKITFHIYLPATAPAIDWIQPFYQDTDLAYFGAYTLRGSLTFGAWNTIVLTLPSTALPKVQWLGVEFHTSGNTSLSDEVYIDAIDW